MVGNLVLHSQVEIFPSQGFHHQLSPKIRLLTSLHTSIITKLHHHHSEMSDRILSPTYQMNMKAVNSIAQIMDQTVITEGTEVISSMKMEILMAGPMTMITEEKVIEMKDGAHLNTSKCYKDIVL